MYCPNCGRPVPEAARFCPDCGAAQPSAQPIQPTALTQPVQPQARHQPAQPASRRAPLQPPKKRRAGLIVGVIAAVAAIALAVVLIVHLTGGDGSSGRGGSRADSSDRDDRDGEETGRNNTSAGDDAPVRGGEEDGDDEAAASGGGASVLLRDILLAESVRTAQLSGRCAGSTDYLEMAGTPADAVAYAQSYAVAAELPGYALWCGDSAALMEQMSDIMGAEHAARMAPSALGAWLNGQFAGQNALVGASIVSASQAVCLPAALPDTAVAVLCYPDSGVAMYACITPSGGTVAGIACTPVASDVFETSGMSALDCWEPVDGAALEAALARTEDLSLRAEPAGAAADDAWCLAVAEQVLAHVAGADESLFEQYTADPAVLEQAIVFRRAAAAGATDSRVREVMLAGLLGDEIVEFNMDALEEAGLTELIMRRIAANAPTSVCAAFGANTVAANSILLAAASQTPADYTCALPEDFGEGRVVALTLPGGCGAVVALYDAGNNILGASVAFVPGMESAEDLQELLEDLIA